MSDKPLSSSEQVSGTHAIIHAEVNMRLLAAYEEAWDRPGGPAS